MPMAYWALLYYSDNGSISLDCTYLGNVTFRFHVQGSNWASSNRRSKCDIQGPFHSMNIGITGDGFQSFGVRERKVAESQDKGRGYHLPGHASGHRWHSLGRFPATGRRTVRSDS